MAKFSIEDKEAQSLRHLDHPIPTTLARAYAIKAREDQDALEVIVVIFSLYDIEMHALINLGSTHSYICIEHVFDKIPTVAQLAYDMHVTSPLGHSVSVNSVYRNCPIIIQVREFLVDLINLPFREFDLIMEMDWLSKHRAIVDCGQKTIVLRCSDKSEVIVQGIRSSAMSNVISFMQARRLMTKDCETFLALILDSKRGQFDVEKIPIVREFADVFPEELPGIPLVTPHPKRVYSMCNCRVATKGFLNYLSVIVVFLKVVFKDEIAPLNSSHEIK